jgi:hemerythrin-like metal-binding protein
MKRLELTADLKTGIDAIDKQHQELFSWANAVSADDIVADEKKLKEALSNLDRYVVEHFRTEEEAMKNYNYDRLEKHQAQHHRLMREVSDLYRRLYREEASKGLMVELQYMFADWFNLHIKEWDKHFATFLKNKNLSI